METSLGLGTWVFGTIAAAQVTIGLPLLWLAESQGFVTYNQLALVCAVGGYCAVLLVIAIATLVTVRDLYRELFADDDYTLLKRQVRRVQREMMDELRREARTWEIDRRH
jgi:hypothetical protein